MKKLILENGEQAEWIYDEKQNKLFIKKKNKKPVEIKNDSTKNAILKREFK